MITERAARVYMSIWTRVPLDSYERRHDISGEERTSRTLLKVIIAQTSSRRHGKPVDKAAPVISKM